MLCEIECRALSAAHKMLIQDFEPKDALPCLENRVFNEDQCQLISRTPTRLERIANFLRLYRRQATDLVPIIEFFEYNHQDHLADFLKVG